MHRRRHLLSLLALACLVIVSAASADTANTFTASGEPGLVKASASGSYTLGLTSDALSPGRAHKASIGIPPGFTVDPTSVQANTSPVAGQCDASAWEADGELIVDQRIRLRRAGGDTTALCPGATLTVTFAATSAAADGTYTWTAELTHEVDGPFALTGLHPSVVVDGTAPEATITQKPSDPSNIVSPVFGFTADEAASFECKLDAGAFAPCSSPKDYSGLADGGHTFALRAIDAAGNTGAEATFEWTVDTAEPTVSIGSKPGDPSTDASASLSFSANEASSYECRLDAGAFAPCASPKSYAALAEGGHTFAVRATDEAGNTGGTATYHWTVDTAAPTVGITGKPSSPSNDTSPTFQFAPSEPASLACRVGSGAFATCTSPATFPGLGEGSHTFEVKATDAAGNEGAASTYTWTVDLTAPLVSIGSKPGDPSNDTSPTFTFSADGTASFQCKLDGGGFEACGSPKTFVGLGEGAHSFSLRATDAAGNTSAEATYGWAVDTTPPTATIAEKPADPSNSQAAAFTFNASEAGAGFTCKLDSGTAAPCSSPRNLTDLAEGSHTFTVAATDAAGNTGAPATYSWAVDTVAPSVSINGKPTDPTNAAAPSFTFTAEAGSSFSCRLDGGTFAPCTAPKTYPVLTDGSHTFEVHATDAAGNTGPVAAYTWVVDTVAPTVGITGKPGSLTNQTNANFTFTAGEAATFQCKLDGAPFAACTSPKAYTNLGDGSHAFVVKATDQAGNTSTETAAAWTVDTVAPVAAITQKPSDPSNTSFPTFHFGAAEADSTFQCKLDGAAFTPCTSPKSYANLAEISHTFVVKATDPAGNTGPETSYTWTIDTTPPVASITGHPDNPSNVKSPSFQFGADESATFACRLDTPTFTPCTSPKAYTNLADGSHTLTIRATDAAGNQGATVSYQWTIDTTAPIVAIGQKPNDPTMSTAAHFTFSAGDATQFECRLDSGAFAACTSPIDYAVVEGSHTFAVRATDALGNAGLASTYTWRVDVTAPTTTITAKPSAASSDSSPTFTFASSENGGTFACRLEQGGFAPCSSPKTYQGLSDGEHTFGVRSTDAAGNVGAETSVVWTIDTVAPTASIAVKPSNPSNGGSASFTFTASEAGGTFVCKLDGAAQFTACASPAAYTSLADGAHTFSVRAVDAAQNTGVAATYTWIIDTVLPVVSITAKPANPSNLDDPSFSFSANEPATFQCSLDTPTPVSCTSPRPFTNVADGSHTFVVRARDSAGNTAVAEYTWTIDTAAPTTTITTKPANPSNVKSPSFAYTASEAAQFQCKLDTGAYGACVSPANLADGQHTFNVRATDTAGNTGVPASYTWVVDTVAPAAAIGSKPANPSNSASPSFTFTTNEAGSTFACKLDGQDFASCSSPAGYSSVGDGPHAFSVRATDAAGNTGAAASYGWTVETRAPTAVLTSAPAGLTNSSAATFSFAANEPSTFECSIDGAGFEPCSSPATQYGLGDGGHAFAVRAKDMVGNLSSPVGHSWTIDTTSPETTLAAAPQSGTATSASFTFTASEGGTFECRIDGAPFALCASPRAYVGLARGEHRFEVRAIDPAGNADASPAGHTWTVQAPAIVVRTAAASALLAPKAGAKVTKPPVLVWRRAARASYYNLQLFRGKQKLLSAWPTRARFQVRARWRFNGRQQRLTPGTYRWFVWPGYGAPSRRNYGSLLGQSTFVVQKRR